MTISTGEARVIGSVTGSSADLRVEILAEDEWQQLRNIRLTARRDHPSAFLSSLKQEEAYDERRWRQELARGEWNILLAGDKAVGILGVTRGPDTLPRECHFEQLWIAPGFRRIGAGSMLLQTALDRLQGTGIRTVSLYVLNGNTGATVFYEKFGFENTNEPHLLPCHKAGGEELMRLSLDGGDGRDPLP